MSEIREFRKRLDRDFGKQKANRSEDRRGFENKQQTLHMILQIFRQWLQNLGTSNKPLKKRIRQLEKTGATHSKEINEFQKKTQTARK